MLKVLATLSTRQDLTNNLVECEIQSLAELFNVDVDFLNGSTIELSGRMDNIVNLSCRSVFIREIDVNGNKIKFPRSFIIDKRPIQRVDTCSAPLEIFLSRLLLNLAKVREYSKVLDPFSGVGGVLFEARMLGAYTLGIDIFFRYVKVQNRNLDYYADQIVSDSSCQIPLKYEKFDSVVSDPPYSKLSITDVDLDVLYMSLAKICYLSLKRGGIVAVSCICTIPIEDYLEDYGFDVQCIGFQFVHRTLVRKIIKAVKT